MFKWIQQQKEWKKDDLEYKLKIQKKEEKRQAKQNDKDHKKNIDDFIKEYNVDKNHMNNEFSAYNEITKVFNEKIKNTFTAFNNQNKPLFTTSLHYNGDGRLVWIANSYKPQPLWQKVITNNSLHISEPKDSFGLKLEEENTSRDANNKDENVRIDESFPNHLWDDFTWTDRDYTLEHDFIELKNWIDKYSTKPYTQTIKGYAYLNEKPLDKPLIEGSWSPQEMCLSDRGFYMVHYLQDISQDNKPHIVFFKDPNGHKCPPMMLTYNNTFIQKDQEKINDQNFFYLDYAYLLNENYKKSNLDHIKTSVYQANIQIPQSIKDNNLQIINYTTKIDTASWCYKQDTGYLTDKWNEDGIYGPMCSIKEIVYYDKDDVRNNEVQAKTYNLNNFLKTYEEAKNIMNKKDEDEKDENEKVFILNIKKFLSDCDYYFKSNKQTKGDEILWNNRPSLKNDDFYFINSSSAKWNLFSLLCDGIVLDKQLRLLKEEKENKMRIRR